MKERERSVMRGSGRANWGFPFASLFHVSIENPAL
jgi:hypothetical protein